jgi:hypothetical protein
MSSGPSGGGAIAILEVNTGISFESSTFTNCTAQSAGGAIAILESNTGISFESSTFIHCSAAIGGALYVYDSNTGISFNTITFTSCSAQDEEGVGNGGAVAVTQSNAGISFNTTVFTSCSAQSLGGAFYMQQGNSDVSFQSSTFTGCSTGARGGAIFLNTNNNDFVVESSRFLNNTAGDGTNPGMGGAIYAGENNLRMALLGGGVERRVWSVPHFTQAGPSSTATYHWQGNYQAFVILFSPNTVLSEFSGFSVMTEFEMKSYGLGGYFPGVNISVLILPGSSLTLSLTSNPECSGDGDCPGPFGGFPVYIYGLPEKVGDTELTNFLDNSATESGGAVGILKGNYAAVLLGVDVIGNKAEGSGGGIYLETVNFYATFINAHFARNKAKLLGGGLAIEVSHTEVQLVNCSFLSNEASSGGGLGISTLNIPPPLPPIPQSFLPLPLFNLFLVGGVGINISQSSFVANQAVEGGAVYSLSTNNLVIQDSDMTSNVASSKGGGCFLGSSSAVLIEALLLSSNSANVGGAVHAETNSQLFILSCNITGNVATTSGGGMFLDSLAQFSVFSLTLTHNSAGSTGGGLFLLNTPAWKVLSSSYEPVPSEIVLRGNNATWGSAVFFNASDAITQQRGLTNMSVSSNRALSGGTIFWVAQQGKKSTALDINSSTNTWGENAAAYGEQVATQAVQFGGLPDRVNISSSPAKLAPFHFTIWDYYGQTVKQNASVVNTVTTQGKCGLEVSASFVNISDGSQPVESGVANFSSVLARCTPGGSIVVQFSTSTKVFSHLSKLVSYSFSPCQAGDTFVQGTCTICPEGQFSLSYTGPSTNCLPCNVISGVASCSGNDLILFPGYWRQSATTGSVKQCQEPGARERCIGGAPTGDASCKSGSQGPLCGVCSDGYYDDFNGDCFECDNSGAGSSGGVIVIFVILGLAAAYYIAKRVCATEERKSDNGDDGDGDNDNDNGGETSFRSRIMRWIWGRKREVLIKVKIFVVTIQVVSSIPSSIGTQLPSSVLNFFGLFRFLSFDYATIIPFECWIEYDYVDILLVTTITPIAISMMIYLACQIEVSCYTRDAGQRGEREVKAQYYQYFLYLTYLVLPSVTAVIFGMFPCLDIDDQEENQYYLRNDLSISCSSERYITGVTIAALMILVYPFGIPAFYFWQLFLHRDLIRYRSDENSSARSAEVAAKYGFLYESYEPRLWYWESVEAIRRIILTGVLSVLSPLTSTQSVLGMTLSLLYIGLYSQYRPYENDKDDTLAFVGQYQIFWTFFGTLVIRNSLLGSKQDNNVAILMIVGNLAVLFLGSYYEITDYRHEVGLQNFEEVYFGQKLPFNLHAHSERTAQTTSEQMKPKKESSSISRNPLSLTQVGKEREMDKSSNAKAISPEPQRNGSKDRFEEELKRINEEGLDEATVSQKGFLNYMKYAFMEKEALRQKYREKSRNLDRRLFRVKKRLLNVNRAGAEKGRQSQVEMTENPLRDLTGSNI